AERTRKLLLKRGVRPVVGAANDVRDLEIVVVDDARQVVRRAAVRPKKRRTPEPDRAGRVRASHPGGGLPGPLGALALADRAVVPGNADPLELGEDLIDRALDLTCAVG